MVNFNKNQYNQGFTLVEIMVAMVVGLLGMLIMLQMLSIFEGQKRTTTGGDDANNAGAIALFGLTQTVQLAGFCFSSGVPAAASGILGAAPVKITPGTATATAISDANTDMLVVAFTPDSCTGSFISAVMPTSASSTAPLTAVQYDAQANGPFSLSAYAVKNGNLRQCDYLASNCATDTGSNWTSVAAGVVSLKAECSAGQAVRLALVTRNAQLEKLAVTPASSPAPSWSGASPIVMSAVSADAGFSWQNYRYKTFETLTPLRNAIWQGGVGCN